MHAKEPWEVKEGFQNIIVISDEPLQYAIVNGYNSSENSKRIIACVNACAGIPDDVLAGALHHGVDPLQKKIANIMAALDTISMFCGTPDAAQGCRNILQFIAEIKEEK